MIVNTGVLDLPSKSRETLRHRARDFVNFVRVTRSIVITVNNYGYWLALDAIELASYVKRRRQAAMIHHKAESRTRRSQAASDATGQQMLFKE